MLRLLFGEWTEYLIELKGVTGLESRGVNSIGVIDSVFGNFLSPCIPKAIDSD